ncbi:IS4 family transposase [Enterobacter hormaechei]|uniref:IS4 family transposase n=1 Tax=Enterobacteriaceae TaxID=543 RepID=UPI00299106C4|nr:IS4 family transposase [Klebsiella pneumoniae]HCB3283551.1 IS4 family transposase [Klebsiella pneumoniae]HCB3512311.1 IS4 family transposase [Klebsiella pneumoniae]HCB3746458.1 IS4 family transposase [Escherichia coli]
MNVKTMLADFLSFVTPKCMHKARFLAVGAAVQSLMQNGQCTVTAIGRGFDSKTSEKHSIKRADRLLKNEALQAETPLIYAAITRLLIQGKQPLILVDWSNADTEKRHHILRASLALEGRPLTLHQVVVPMDEYTCPHVHKAFLHRLKQVLPANFKPVIITDAGFKVPWFKQIRKLGWHYIARVRGNQTLQLPGQEAFVTVAKVYKKARSTPQRLGEVKLTKAQQYRTQAVLVGTGWKLRKSDKHKQYKEPWLLVSSLPDCFNYATKIAKCYGKRMQIEESFRDQKSQTYGLGSEAHRTYKRKRLEVLLLLAALANWLHYMIGLAAELAGKHLQFQANSIKHRRVLSFNYLGMRLSKAAQLGLTEEEMQAARRQIMLWAAESDWGVIKLEKS